MFYRLYAMQSLDISAELLALASSLDEDEALRVLLTPKPDLPLDVAAAIDALARSRLQGPLGQQGQ